MAARIKKALSGFESPIMVEKQNVTTPRKRPRQARARLTVGAILEATAQILAKDGLRGLTTNRVAERAGISIGSLYQYFPNKSALITALMEAHVRDELRVLGKAFEEFHKLPLPAAIHQLISSHVKLHRADLELTRALHADVPRLGIAPVLRKATQAIEEQLVQLLKVRPERLAPRDLKLAAFLIVNGVETLNERYLLERPEFCSETLVAELTAMVLGYLNPQGGRLTRC